MKNRKIGVLSCLMIMMSLVGYNQGTTQINGKLKKGRGDMVYLQHSVDDKLVKIDSSKVNFFGKYRLSAEVEKHGFYKLTTNGSKEKSILLILKGGEKISIKSTADSANKSYTIKGSDDCKLIQQYDAVKTNDSVSKDSLSNYASQFVKNNSKSLVVFVALNDIKNPEEAITIAEKGIGETYPNTLYHASLKAAVTQIAQAKAKAASAKARGASGTSIGSIAPEVNMLSPDGKLITLESLKGKYVLIDFWASWCGPCRRENPTVVRLYNKYKDQGFDVYSVSLDKDKNRWIGAIKQDKLTWPNHVSDLRGWGSAACKIYGFRGIPYTVLIDKEGKIMATRLRGGALANKLKQIFGN